MLQPVLGLRPMLLEPCLNLWRHPSISLLRMHPLARYRSPRRNLHPELRLRLIELRSQLYSPRVIHWHSTVLHRREHGPYLALLASVAVRERVRLALAPQAVLFEHSSQILPELQVRIHVTTAIERLMRERVHVLPCKRPVDKTRAVLQMRRQVRLPVVEHIQRVIHAIRGVPPPFSGSARPQNLMIVVIPVVPVLHIREMQDLDCELLERRLPRKRHPGPFCEAELN